MFNKKMFNKRLEVFNTVIEKSICIEHDNLIDIDQALIIFKSYITQTKKNSGIVYTIGNGGSAGIASHFSNDLIKALKIPANTLVDSNILTCLANDFGYDKCYSEALKINMKKSDLLVAISSSGNSLNIVNATKIAKEKGAKVVTLSGFLASNLLRNEGDLNFWIDIADYGIVEMAHFFILHTLVDLFYTLDYQKLNMILENAR